MKAKKEHVARKGSITALLIHLLSLANVPSDEEIISRAKAEKKGSKFGKSQLAWYKSKFRSGQLTGMDKKSHVIAQKQAPKKTAAPKTKAKKGLGLKPKKALQAVS